MFHRVNTPKWQDRPEESKDKLDLSSDANQHPGLGDALKKHLMSATEQIWNIYPEPRDTYLLLAEKFNLNVNQLMLLGGSDFGVRAAIDGFVIEGRATVSYWPTYASAIHATRLHGGHFVPCSYQLINNIAQPTEDLAEAAHRHNARFVYVAYPDSYMGYIPSLPDIARLCESVRDGYVIVDEVYADYVGSTCLPLLSRHKNLIVVRSFAKTHGLAGARIGFLAADPAVIDHLLMGRSLGGEVSGVAAWALKYLLNEGAPVVQESIRSNKAGLEMLRTFLIKAGGSVIESKACNLLLKKDFQNPVLQNFLDRIIVREFSPLFGILQDYYRISAAPEEIIKPLLAACSEGLP